jgi:hypothetical protein
MALALLAPGGVAHLTEDWAILIPPAQWKIYRQVIAAAQKAHIPFALGGAFAVATYTGSWRDTKDLDLYVLPEYRERMIEVLTRLGFTDYYEKVPYDRWWIYRSTSGDTIVDVIWAMANHRAQIDELWMSGPEIDLHEFRVQVLPAEAMLWDKLYIMQRDRCDWPDVMNLIYSAGNIIDWDYLINRMGEDRALLGGALTVFRWISPGRALDLPKWIWGRLCLDPPSTADTPEIVKRRVDLLDTRPWYGPDREKLKPAA